MKHHVLPCLLPIFLTATAWAQDDGHWWNNWRGPDGTGIAPASNPPVDWSEEKNIRWKVSIPGRGSSSPIVWRNRIYVTTAIDTGEVPEGMVEKPTEFSRYGTTAAPISVHEFAVLALNREDGATVWRKTLTTAVPHEGGHRTASQASLSPITDGERIYVHFGSRGLYCLDMNGAVLWSKDFGLMRTFREFGEGCSPALQGDTLVVNWDHEEESYIVAFDKFTGRELWRTPREEGTSWATPLIAPVGDDHQVIIAATNASRSYDLESGELLWTLTGMSTTPIPSPIYSDGVAYLMSGFRSSNLQAVRLAGAEGDLDQSRNVIWNHERNTSYVPSALVYDNFVYFLRLNSGVLSCLDATTGTPHYEGQRLGMRSVYSSPVGAAGRVYVTSRNGITVVFTVGPTYEELATNQLDDAFDATAAIVGDEIYLRGAENLYCIAREARD